MTALFTADIHQTSNPRDEYRWGLFDWLSQQIDEHHVDVLFTLGDLTDSKDRHNAVLVRRMVAALRMLAKKCLVVVLKGNHDYVNPAEPFFGFVQGVDGIIFAGDPCDLICRVARDDVSCLLLPSVAAPVDAWGGINFNDYEYVFCHQTFRGALRENGTASEDGVPASYFGDFHGQVYSGDIHVPQRFKRLYGPEYIGAPYRIDFGDQFKPRVLLIDEAGKKRNLFYPCPSKHLLSINNYGELALGKMGDILLDQIIKPGDQVKVRVTLKRADFTLWPKLRKDIQAMAEAGGWHLFGPELVADKAETPVRSVAVSTASHIKPAELVRAYAEEALGELGAENSALVDIGVGIVEGLA